MKKTAMTVKTKSLLACALVAATLLPRVVYGGLYEEAKAYWSFDAYHADGAAAATTISNACSKSYTTAYAANSQNAAWTNSTVRLPNRPEKAMTSLYLPVLKNAGGVITNGTQISVTGSTIAGTNITFFTRFRYDGLYTTSTSSGEQEGVFYRNGYSWGSNGVEGSPRGHQFALFHKSDYGADNAKPAIYFGRTRFWPEIVLTTGKWYDMAISISGDSTEMNWTCIVVDDASIKMLTGSQTYDALKPSSATSSTCQIGSESTTSASNRKNFNGAIQRMAVWDRALSVNEMLEAMESGYVQKDGTFKARVTAESSNGTFGKVKVVGGSYGTSVTNIVATNGTESVSFMAKAEDGYSFARWELLTEHGTTTSLYSPSITVSGIVRPVALRAIFNPVVLRAYWRFDKPHKDGVADTNEIEVVDSSGLCARVECYEPNSQEAIWTNETVRLPNRPATTMTSLYLPGVTNEFGVVTNGTLMKVADIDQNKGDVNRTRATVFGTNITFFARFRPDGFSYATDDILNPSREMLLHKNGTYWKEFKGHIFGLYSANGTVENPVMNPRFYIGHKTVTPAIPISTNKWYDMAVSISGDDVTSSVNYKCVVLGESGGVNMAEGMLDLQGQSTNAASVIYNWIGGDAVGSKHFNGAIQRMAVWDCAMDLDTMLRAMESGYVVEDGVVKARVTADSSNGSFGKVSLDGGSYVSSVTNVVATNATGTATFSAQPEPGYVFCGWEWRTAPGTITSGFLGSPSITVAVTGRPMALRAVFNRVDLKAYWRFDTTREDGEASADAIKASCSVPYTTSYEPNSKKAVWTNETVKLFNRDEKTMTSLYLPAQVESTEAGLSTVSNGTQVYVKNATVTGTNITFFARFRLDGLSYADKDNYPERREGVFYRNSYTWSNNRGHQFSLYCPDISTRTSIPVLYFGQSIVYPNIGIEPGRWYDLAISLYGDGVSGMGGYTCLVVDDEGKLSRVSEGFDFSAMDHVATNTWNYIGGQGVDSKNFNGAIQRMAVWDGAMGVNEMLAAMEYGYIVTNNDLYALVSAEASNDEYGQVKAASGSYASSAYEAFETNTIGSATFTAQAQSGCSFGRWEWITTPGTITAGSLTSPTITVAQTEAGRPIALRAVFWPLSSTSYIKDGLVAHYDGIENDGAGLPHNSSATTWKNLTGDATLDGTCAGTIGWAYDGWTNNAVGVPVTVGAGLSDTTGSGTFTMEFACTPSRHTSRQCFFSQYLENVNLGGIAIEHNSGSVSDGRLRYYRYRTSDATTYSEETIPPVYLYSGDWHTVSLGLTNKDSRLVCRLDGSWTNTAASAFGKPKSGFNSIIGGDPGRNYMAFRGKYNTFRLYDRVLTDDENVVNAAIDAARFNGATPADYNDRLSADSDYMFDEVGHLCVKMCVATGDAAAGTATVSTDWADQAGSTAVTFTAVPNVAAGCSFVRWEGEGVDQLADPHSPIATVNPTSPMSLTAVFCYLSSKSYVSKGLVAHYDGIDNAGTGTHNSSATTWKNLTGDTSLDGTCTNILSWVNGRGWTVPCDCKPVTITNVLISQTLATTNFTMQIACTPAAVNKRMCYFGQMYTMGYGSVNVENWTNGSYRLFRRFYPWIGENENEDFSWQPDIANATANTFSMFAFNVTPSNTALYVGGTMVASEDRPGYRMAWAIPDCESVLGGEPQPGSMRGGADFDDTYKMAFNGEYNTFRLYNRSLTADEEKVNAAIDAIRFNDANPADYDGAFGDDSDYKFESGRLYVRMRVATGDAAAGTATVSTNWANQAGTTSVTFTAVPNVAEGCSFVRWEGEGVEQLADSHSATATVNPTSPMNLTAVFCYLSSQSYVSKGLVAHYDGIENDGVGKVHNSSAKKWKNLTGDTTLDGTCTNILSWVKGRGWTVFEDCKPVTVGKGISAILSTTNFTMQIACTPAAVDKRMCYFGQYNSGGNSGYGSVNVENWTDGRYRLYRRRLVENGSDITWQPDIANATANAFASFAFNITPSCSTRYVGGTMVASEDRQGYRLDGATPDRKSVLGGEILKGSSRTGANFDDTYKMTFNGEYNAFRLYNRSLTADEEKVNAAIDAIRFNGASPADYVSAFGVDSDYKFDESGHLYVRMRVATSDAVAGTASVSTNWADQAGLTSVTFTATPAVASGCSFVRWEGEGAELLADPHSPTVTVNPTRPTNLTAVFCYLSSQSYVSKGLVAHYDGIENYGVGLPHNSSATTWKNLTGDASLDGTCAGITWAANGWVNIADGKPVTVGSKLSETTGSGTFTMEFACTPSRDKSQQRFFSQYKASGEYYGSIAIGHNGDGDASTQDGCLSYYKRKAKSGEDADYSEKTPVCLYSNEWHTVSISLANAASPLVCYLDGSWTNTATKAFGQPGSGFESIIGGDPRSTKPWAFYGKYNTFRLYDRVLTADEEKVNAAIDAIRFNGAGLQDADLSGTGYTIDPTGHLFVEVSATAEKNCSVKFGDGALVASGDTNVVKSTVLSITAVTDGAHLFKGWEGDVDAIVGGDARTATISVMADRPLDLRAKFMGGLFQLYK